MGIPGFTGSQGRGMLPLLKKRTDGNPPRCADVPLFQLVVLTGEPGELQEMEGQPFVGDLGMGKMSLHFVLKVI